MSLVNTGLILQVAPLPATFIGTPEEFREAFVRRSRIVSPSGTNFIFTGDVEPSSNAGPWLRNGTQWWVFDASLKRYVPLDITPSERHWYWTGTDIPASSTPPVWLRTSFGPTIDTPPTTTYGRPLGWYVFDGTLWQPFADVVRSGTTAERPNPAVTYEQYYDSDISVLIWFERGVWRTVSGVPGDIKAVGYTTLDDALLHNPGWSHFGASNENLRGRTISGATKDAVGSGGSTDLTTATDVPHRAVGEIFGEGQGLTGNASKAITYPPTVAYYLLTKD